jgi:hypothetical protein
MASPGWSVGGDKGSPPPKIRPMASLNGIEVVDRIEGSRGALLTDSPPELDSAPDVVGPEGPFCFPISTAASFTATTIRTPYRQDIYVRDSDANVVAMATDGDSISLPRGQYTVELPSFPTKVYLAADAAIEAIPQEQTTKIVLDEPRSVYVGARSHHSRPAYSVAVPRTPAGVRQAVSVFGQALKTHSPERSFSTLRGHPPSIAWMDECNEDAKTPIPPSDPPATIRVPDDFESVLQVAPLAYYLGATVEATAGEPVLSVDGMEYPLGTAATEGPRAFEASTLGDAAHRVLRHLFTLDCVVRTVGFYEVPLQAHDRLRERLQVDRQALYDAPLPARTQAYLALPHAPVADVSPRWSLTTDMTATAEEARALPYLATRLAQIRIHEETPSAGNRDGAVSPSDSAGSTPGHAPTTASPNSSSGGGGSSHGGSVGESAPAPQTESNRATPVKLPETNSQQQVWTGSGVAAEATTTRPADFARAAERGTDDLPEQVTIDVICTDSRMDDETIVRDLYGNRQLLEYEVRHHDDATKETVRGVLQGDANLVHYIGHAKPEGLVCDDGLLRPDEVDGIGPDLAVLNGCESERLARAFADCGLLAALATTEKVQNRPAVRLGTAIARLLNGGWPVNAAFGLLSRVFPDTDQYAVVGDGTISLVQHGDGVPTAFTLFRDEMEFVAQVPTELQPSEPPTIPRGKFGVLVETFATPTFETGSFYTSYLDPIEGRALTGGYAGCAVLDPETIEREIGDTAYPVFVNRQLAWACDLIAGERPLIAE